jgi:hypothetical protein
MIKFLWPTFYRWSMRAQWLARQISYLYSISVHALLRKSRVTVATASLVLPASPGKVVVNGGTYIVSLMYPQKKKSRSVRSGERGGQVIGPPLPIHFSGNLLEEMWRHSVLLEQHVIRTLFLQNRQEELLYLRRHFNNCECSASGAKICKLKWH